MRNILDGIWQRKKMNPSKIVKRYQSGPIFSSHSHIKRSKLLIETNMMASTTDFIRITDFVTENSNDDNPYYLPMDDNGVIYDHHDKDLLRFVRIVNSFIPDGAFYSCKHLRIVLMHDSMVYIGSHAFSSCTLLQHVKLSTNIHDIGSHAFKGCKSLSSMFIPDSCQRIDWYAFFNCLSLIILAIPDHTNVGESIYCERVLKTSSIFTVQRNIGPSACRQVDQKMFSSFTLSSILLLYGHAFVDDVHISAQYWTKFRPWDRSQSNECTAYTLIKSIYIRSWWCNPRELHQIMSQGWYCNR